MFLKVACVAEAILRKSALNFHSALSSFSLAMGGLNGPVFTKFGTGTYQTLGHLKSLKFDHWLTFNVFC